MITPTREKLREIIIEKLKSDFTRSSVKNILHGHVAQQLGTKELTGDEKARCDEILKSLTAEYK